MPSMEVANHRQSSFLSAALVILRVGIGVMVALIATFLALGALMFRMEGSDELAWIERVDIAVGLAFAIAFMLLFAPARFNPARRWRVTGLIAGLVWLVVTLILLDWHWTQDRIGSARVERFDNALTRT